MSITLPECNVYLAANSSTYTPVRLAFPGTTTMAKAANNGCVTAFWFRTPSGGYDQGSYRVLLARNLATLGGSDAYIGCNQACTTLTARFRQSNIDYAGAAVLSCAILPGKTYLVMFIVTQNNVHLVACEPGGTPIISTVAQTSSNFYALNLSALTMFDAIGCGSATGGSYSHYGPIGEVCFWQGIFPETVSATLPDSAPIQNIANGTQDLATVHSAILTAGGGSVVKRCRYRLITADDYSDSFGVAAILTAPAATADKVIGSCAPLRPIALAPAFSSTQASQLTFPIAGSTAGATAIINTPGGTYSGISPVAIQARLVKEDRSVLSNWETVATPSSGSWAEGRFAAAQPYTTGWQEIQFKAIDGAGAQLGDIVAAWGNVGTGFNMIAESQSQLMTLFDTTTNGLAITAGIRLQTAHFAINGSVSTAQSRAISVFNPVTRIARGIRQAANEINAIYPGIPISISSVGVGGTPVDDFLAGGAWVDNWSKMKAFLGVTQPYFQLMFGHSNMGTTYNTGALYQTAIGNIKAICESTFGAAIKLILCPTARYAGVASTSKFTILAMVRTAMRDYLAAHPTTTLLGGSWQTVKNDISDGTSTPNPHAAPDLSVGQGRSGSYLGFALMAASRAIKQQPLQIKSVTTVATTLRVKMGPVNLITA